MTGRWRARTDLRVVTAIRIATVWVFAADRRGAIGNALGQVLSAVSTVGLVVLGKVLLDRLLRPGDHSAFATLWPLFVLAAVTGLSASLAVVAAQQQRLTGERVQQAVWRRVLDAVAAVDLVTYESDGFATQFARIERNGISRPLPMVRALFALLGSGLAIVAMTVALFALQPLLPPLLLIAAVPAVVLGRWAARAEFAFARAETPTFLRREYLRAVLSRRQFAAEVRAFGAARMLRPRHAALDEQFTDRLARHVRHRQQLAVLGSVASTVALLLVLTVIVVLVDVDRLTIAQAGAAAIAARLLASSLTRAYGSFGSLAEAAPHIIDLADFVDRTPPSRPLGVRSPLRTAVTFQGVGFTYPTRSVPALVDVDIRIGASEVVALVGENGSGKSTFARVAAGLFEPDTGRIEWDGRSSEAPDRIASTTLLTQDFGRYALSVEDNIAISDHRGPRRPEAVRAAAVRANLDETLASLPDGYDTVLGRELDEGVDLSGGQWQRLALARALFREADLVILDEPSAALDPRAESELFDDVRRVLAGRSALLISHRLSSVRLADRIYVLHGGRVVEHGTHVSLLAAGGHYAELFAMQSAGFLVDAAPVGHGG